MPLGTFVRAVLTWAGAGEEGSISWTVGGLTSTPSDGDMASIASKIDDNWATSSPTLQATFRGLIPAGQALTAIKTYAYVQSNPAAVAQGLHAITGQGLAGNFNCPWQTAICATLQTGRPGRSYRGRQYFPGVTAQVNENDGHMQNSIPDNVSALCAAMGLEVRLAVNQVTTNNDVFWGVLSRTRQVITPISAVRVDNLPDTQRRRRNSLLPTHAGTNPVDSNP